MRLWKVRIEAQDTHESAARRGEGVGKVCCRFKKEDLGKTGDPCIK